MLKRILFPLLISILSFIAKGQNTFSININKYSGLPSSTVYDFLQDSKGFIWIASNAGITRYDGFEFQTYTSTDQTSLSGSVIKEDKYGRIWYQNFDGYLYYVKDEQLHSIKQNRPAEYVPFGIVDDYLFVLQHKGVDIFDLKTLRLLKTIGINASNVISSTVLKQHYYFVAENKVFRIGTDFQLKETGYFGEKGIKVNHINNNGENLFLIYKNTDQHTLYFVNEDLQLKNTTNYPSHGVVLTTQFLDNKYWLYTNKGCFVYTTSGKSVLANELLNLDPSINKCVIDRSKNYWFSSLKGGLYIISDFNNKVYSYDTHDLMNIVKKGNKFLISTLKSQIMEIDETFSSPRKIIDLDENNHILNCMYDQQSDLFFYTTQQGLRIFHNNKDIYFEDIAVKNILKLDEKYYALATSGYVMLLKNPVYKNELFKSKWDNLYKKNVSGKYKNLAPLITNLRAKSLDFYNDSSNFIVASNVGIYHFDTLGYSDLLVENKPFFASDIYTYNKKIYLLDNNGNLHVVYRSGKMNSLNGEIGIPTNGIRFIKRFDNMLYLVCTNRVFEYDLTQATTSTYSFSTNMLSITDLIRTDDLLVLVAGKDIVTIGLNKKSIQKTTSEFYFNNFYVGHDKVSKKELLSLKNDQNSIKITYSLLDYGSSKEPRVSYRLNRGEWVQLTAGTREIQLLSLSPGEYELEVKMGTMIVSDKIHFNISFPFYMKWWFILMNSAILSSIFIIVYIWRLKLMRKKIRQLNERIVLENELRTSMLTSIKAQMNPHFFYNALNTIQSYIFSNDKFHATTYLAKFSKLTRMILEMSGQTRVKLEDEVASLKLYLELEQMRFQSDFQFKIEIDKSLDMKNIEIPSMLIQPYVENAVKHGLLHKKDGEKHVSIIFKDKTDMIEVVINDNGIGRKQSEEINSQKLDKPKSFSTESNQKRLDLLNHDKNIVSVQFEDKYDENHHSLGTTVTLFISKK